MTTKFVEVKKKSQFYFPTSQCQLKARKKGKTFIFQLTKWISICFFFSMLVNGQLPTVRCYLIEKKSFSSDDFIFTFHKQPPLLGPFLITLQKRNDHNYFSVIDCERFSHLVLIAQAVSFFPYNTVIEARIFYHSVILLSGFFPANLMT